MSFSHTLCMHFSTMNFALQYQLLVPYFRRSGCGECHRKYVESSQFQNWLVMVWLLGVILADPTLTFLSVLKILISGASKFNW
jgi:hypothetical protein